MTGARKMVETCACHRIRVAARALTRAYDEAFRPLGLRATQVSLLAAVAVEGALSIRALAQTVGMDRSTLTRNLAPLERERLLAVGGEGWRRSRTVRITARGAARLEQALPLWEGAQRRLKKELGPRRWDAVQTSVGHLIGASSGARPSAGRRRGPSPQTRTGESP